MPSRHFRRGTLWLILQIILKENVPGLGAEADIVKVRKGFARNHLIPTGKAYEVTPSNLKRLNQLKSQRAEREARELNEAEDFARKIGKVKLEFTLETGETGKGFWFGHDQRYRRKAPDGIRDYDRPTQDRLRAPDQREWRERDPHQASSRCCGDLEDRDQIFDSCRLLFVRRANRPTRKPKAKRKTKPAA